MIHRLVNLDYPETNAQRRLIEARQLASRRVTRPRRACPCAYCKGTRHLTLTDPPAKLAPLPKRFLQRLASVNA